MRLSEHIEKYGFFWLPRNPENKLPGVLRISETGKTELEVLGIFSDNIIAELNNKSYHLGRIVGEMENGDPVTLEDCFYTNKGIKFDGISKPIISSHLVLNGYRFNENESILFSRFDFSVEGLDEWLMVSGLRFKPDLNKISASIHFTPPQEISIQLPDGIRLTFRFNWCFPGAPIITEAKITQKAYISLTSDSLRSIDDYKTAVFRINNFLCFAMDKTVSLNSVTAYSCDIIETASDKKNRKTPIKIYYQSIPLSESKLKIHRHGMLFNYSDIAIQLEFVLNNWFKNYETSEPAFNLYFASKSGAHRYIDGKFLSLVQGIETLHRRNSHETMMKEKEFNDLITKILNDCPEDKRDWLKNKLNYANELPLRKRLEQMVDPFRNFYGNKTQCGSFINQVVDTRNYLTHYDKKLSKKALIEGEKLWKLCMKLEGLFQLHFLRLIGLSSESINKMADNNYPLRSKLQI